ncbi:MAG: ParA family protein [Saccharospirillaceae bacterium]|nr:ParA family protein [Pseudomonadales bacterium]NRB80345.1 ParA family protein [Saccharospirillaceae bacterium]
MADTNLVPVVLFINNKGGVGKTTITQLFAEYACVKKEQRVLIIGFDGQMNLEEAYIDVVNDPDLGKIPPIHPEWDELTEEEKGDFNARSSITDWLLNKLVMPYPTAFVETEKKKGLIDIIPCSDLGMELMLNRSTGIPLQKHIPESIRGLDRLSTEQICSSLAAFCVLEEVNEDYDVIILDVGPTKGPLFTAALRAATHVITPFNPENKSLTSLTGMLSAFKKAQLERVDEELKAHSIRKDPIHFVGCLANEYKANNNIHKENLIEARKTLGNLVFPEGLELKNQIAILSTTNPIDSRRYKSYWMMPSSNTSVKASEPIFEYIYDKVMGEQTNA